MSEVKPKSLWSLRVCISIEGYSKSAFWWVKLNQNPSNHKSKSQKKEKYLNIAMTAEV